MALYFHSSKLFNVIYRKVAVEIFHRYQREFSAALSPWRQFDTIFMLPVIRIVMNFMIEVPVEFSMLNFARNDWILSTCMQDLSVGK